jgi:hypothetical protein
MLLPPDPVEGRSLLDELVHAEIDSSATASITATLVVP